MGLQVEPEARAGLERLGEFPCRVGGDAALAAHDLVDPLHRDAEMGGERHLRNLERLQELFAQNLTRVSRDPVFRQHGSLLHGRNRDCPVYHLRSALAGQSFKLHSEALELARNDVPDEAVVDRGVSVRQHIAHPDNAPDLLDRTRGFWIGSREPMQRLADDLELALDRRAQHSIGLLRLKSLPGDKLSNSGDRLGSVPNQLPCLRLHTGFASSARSLPSGGGS